MARGRPKKEESEAKAKPPKTEVERVRVGKLRTDGGTQARAAVDPDVAAEYAEMYRAGKDMPMVRAVRDEAMNYWVWDGHQRLAGAVAAGQKTLLVDVREGTVEDARWLAASANQGHGARRTNADKANAVRMALTLKPDMSDRMIADHCGVSDKTVAKQRSTAEVPQSNTRIGRDGRVYDFTPADAEPAPEATDNGPPDEGIPPHPADLRIDPATLPEAVAVGENLQPVIVPNPAATPKTPTPEPAPPEAEPELDRLGVPVLEAHRAAFAANAEFDALKNAVQAAVKLARRLREAPGGYHLGDMWRTLESARNSLRFARPYTRCPYCMGRKGVIDPSCKPCVGTGWATERTFESAHPNDKRPILDLVVRPAAGEAA